jgi:hypothetical protein
VNCGSSALRDTAAGFSSPKGLPHIRRFSLHSTLRLWGQGRFGPADHRAFVGQGFSPADRCTYGKPCSTMPGWPRRLPATPLSRLTGLS